VGDWAHAFPVAWIVGSLVAGFAAGWGAARAFPAVKRALVSPAAMRAAVADAAREAFERFRVRRTAGGTGVLIYVSSFERMARVEGDAAVCDWAAVCEAVVAELKAGRCAEAFEAGIARVGAALAEQFPAGEDNPDELHNGLRVLLE
jgi:putative membrane protein